MSYQHHIKINLRGGIASVGMMSALLNAAKKVGIKGFRIGMRQQLLTTVSLQNSNYLQKALQEAHIDFEVDTELHPNIISSYPAAAVFHSSEWLTEGGYQDIFNQYTYRPRLKINISDNKQSFTPLFTGHLNFVASPHSHYWYLYVRFPKSNNMICWDSLIYSTEIAHISQLIEDYIFKNENIKWANFDKTQFQNDINANHRLLTRPITEDLAIPRFMLPYYEGFNRYGDKTWLGIYRRNEFFKLSFLEDLTQLCQETKIGQICLTPWRSLIIKGIEENDRLRWEKLLGKHNINLRHAAIELNWQHTDNAIEDVILKNEIVEVFNRRDARTFGVCFAIKSKPKSEVFGSIIIKKRTIFGGLLNGYRILYKENFNPNSRKSYVFKEFALRVELPNILLKLYEKYQHSLNENPSINTDIEDKEENPVIKTSTQIPLQYKSEIYACPNCFTIYDPEFGDELNDIPSGTPFNMLPSTYACSVCDTEKADFILQNDMAFTHIQ
jgi:rubredoxin